MGNYSKKVIKKHSDILLGTVETHNCDPLMDCPECRGTGTCQECRGQGEVKCHNCHGNGKCPECHGKGNWRCDACAGTGNCKKCRGTGEVRCSHCKGRGQVKIGNQWENCPKCGGSGYTPCPDCRSGLQTAVKVMSFATFGAGKTYGKGSGKCQKCGGSGEIICKTCDGNGDCQTCHGSGQLTCEHCGGSGECPNCDHGKVTCTRCDGSGFYQSFMRQKTTLYAKGWTWAGSTDYRDIIGAGLGLTLHSGPVKTWSDARTVSSDETDAVNKKCIQGLGENKMLYGEFLEEYSKQTELVKPDEANDKPYAKVMDAQKIPVTKIAYSINNQDYEMLVVGNNHIVATKSIPTVVKGFELTKWQKIRLALTESARLKAYARLAAYIFQCDGKSAEESILLEAMIKARHLNPQKEEKFRAELASLNTQMPYKKLRKMIRPLLASKKTLTFAWECMAIDKKVSPQEEELFAKIAAEYKLSEAEVTRYKGMAQRFARLKPDQIAKEYADLADEMASLRKKVWIVILSTLAALLFLLYWNAPFFNSLMPNPDDKYTYYEYADMARQETEGADYNMSDDYDTSYQYDIYYGSVEDWNDATMYVRQEDMTTTVELRLKKEGEWTSKTLKLIGLRCMNSINVYKDKGETDNKEYSSSDDDDSNAEDNIFDIVDFELHLYKTKAGYRGKLDVDEISYDVKFEN